MRRLFAQVSIALALTMPLCLGVARGAFSGEDALTHRLEKLIEAQDADGAWLAPAIPSSPLYNAHLILLYAYRGEIPAKRAQVQKLMQRIWSLQNEDGSFAGFQGAPGNVGIGAVVWLAARAAQVAGAVDDDPRLLRLEASIAAGGGLKKADQLAAPYLMLFGLDQKAHCVPQGALKRVLSQDPKLPWVRVLLFPIQYLLETGAIRELDASDRLGALRGCKPRPRRVDSELDRRFLKWVRRYVNEDGTVFDYVPTTIPVLMALHELKQRVSAEDQAWIEAQIARAQQTIEGFQIPGGEGGLIQSPGEGSVAETVEVGFTLLDAGVVADSEPLQRAVGYLLSAQNPDNGGFGFSKHNRHFPDPDDTGLVMSFLSRVHAQAPSALLESALDRAMGFLLQRPNSDGGFGSWELDQDMARWFRPIARGLERRGFILTKSVAEATTRVIHGLSTRLHTRAEAPELYARAIRWLLDQQERDGSFEGTWMMGYQFGTASALTALGTAVQGAGAAAIADKIPREKLLLAIARAIRFLKRSQAADGSLGESPLTYEQGRSVPLERPSPALTGIILSRLWIFLEAEGFRHRPELESLLKKATGFLEREIGASREWSDPTWTAVSFPKIEYAIYPFVQVAEAERCLWLARRYGFSNL